MSLNPLFLLFSLSVLLSPNQMPEEFDYPAAWKEVDQLIQKQLPKSALEKVEIIKTEARKEKNGLQSAKASYYIGTLLLQTEEDGLEKAIARYEKDIPVEVSPYQNVMLSQLASLYQQYFAENRYQISQRTSIEDVTDIRSWSTQSFLQKIDDLFQKSLLGGEDLTVQTNELTELLRESFNQEGIERKPRAFDLLVGEYLEFLKQGDWRSIQPVKGFSVSDPAYFQPAQEFAQLVLVSEDDQAPEFRMLKLFQSALKHRLQDAALQSEEQALIFLDWQRLQYVHHQYSGTDGDSLFLASTLDLIQRAEPFEEYSEMAYEIARILSQKPEQTERALEWCKNGMTKHPNSSGAYRCYHLEQSINERSLVATVREVYSEKQQTHFQLRYKNISRVRLNLYTYDKPLEVLADRYGQDRLSSKLSTAEKVKTVEAELSTKKYTDLDTVLSLGKLEKGFYILEIQSADGENEMKHLVSFFVSHLGISIIQGGEKSRLIVSDRHSSKAIKNARISIYESTYDYRNRTHDLNFAGSVVSDEDGLCEIDLPSKSYWLKINHRGDELVTNAYVQYRAYGETGYKAEELFTDRAIYRPGQTVFFKGLALDFDGAQVPSIRKKDNIRVSVRDVNYQEVWQADLKTNEFGSFTASFTLPAVGLTGQYTIITPNGRKSIRVEEYKRPTFEVSLDTMTSTPKLGDSLTISGTARGLAGYAVSDAAVAYTVYRELSYPYFCGYYPYPQHREMVTAGETRADAAGKFAFAVPTKKENTASIRGVRYHYTIEIKATDLSGETQETTEVISLLDAAFRLSMNIGQELDLSKNPGFTITASNFDDRPVQVSGKYRIIALKKPDDHFDHSYPQPYRGNRTAEFEKWIEAGEVFQGDFITNTPIHWPVKASGVYKIVAEAVDESGIKIETQQYTTVVDFKKGKFPESNLFFIEKQNTVHRAGDEVVVRIGVSEAKSHVYYILSKNNKILREGWLCIKKTKELKFRTTSADRGGLSLRVFGMRNNEVEDKAEHIAIPWDDKELEIKFESFRDKIKPGAEEKYAVKIIPKRGSAAESEILMALYDASLDQFDRNRWRANYYPVEYSRYSFSHLGFGLNQSLRMKYVESPYKFEVESIQLPRLLSYYENYRIMGRRTGKDGIGVFDYDAAPASKDIMIPEESLEIADAIMVEGSSGNEPPNDGSADANTPIKPGIQPRKNLHETTFFFPQVRTNEKGETEIRYTANEALTTWRLMTMAHDKDFRLGYDERTLVTQKEVMIIPNAPRFLRLGDELWFTARISNLTTETQTYTADLQLRNGVDGSDLKTLIVGSKDIQGRLAPGQTSSVAWQLRLPIEADLDLLEYTAVISTDAHSDGESNVLPVFSNLIPVTETQVVFAGPQDKVAIELKGLNEGGSDRIYKRMNIEIVQNPVWSAVQALPYLTASDDRFTTDLVNAYFANIVGQQIVSDHPSIRAVFKIWQQEGGEALKSKLEQNDELKNIVLQESPWVLDALNEGSQKRAIAHFFDANALQNNQSNLARLIGQRQDGSGGFSWISGGRPNPMITLYLLDEVAKMRILGMDHHLPEPMLTHAIEYLDKEILRDYERRITYSGFNPETYVPSHNEILSLLVRSRLQYVAVPPKVRPIYDYYRTQATRLVNKLDIHSQAILGLHLFEVKDDAYQKIQASLLERSFYKKELGRYWNVGNGYNWHQMPVETQCRIMDFLIRIGEENKIIDECRINLMVQKNVNIWPTNKATAHAIYTLLSSGGKQEAALSSAGKVEVIVGGQTVSSGEKVEAGSGLFQVSYSGREINSSMARIEIMNHKNNTVLGGIHLQYLDFSQHISDHANGPLSIEKKLFRVVTSDDGEKLVDLKDGDQLRPGDELVSRLVIRSDRDMDFINLKDLRGAGVEPGASLSGYRYEGNLRYYRSIRDVADHIFIEYLPKGTHVLEQRQKIVHRGTYSSGTASIQSAYAPEFGSHSKGFVITVK